MSHQSPFKPASSFRDLPLLPIEAAFGIERHLGHRFHTNDSGDVENAEEINKLPRPSLCQQFALPEMLLGRDVCCVDRCGSGRTLALLTGALYRAGVFEETFLQEVGKAVYGARYDAMNPVSKLDRCSSCHPTVLILFPAREITVAAADMLIKIVEEIFVSFDNIKLPAATSSEVEGEAAALASNNGNGNDTDDDSTDNDIDADTDLVLYLKREHIAVTLVGGVPVRPQISILREHQPRIIIATPGRCLDMLRRGLIELDCLKGMYFDEVDRLLESGFEEQIQDIIHEACLDFDRDDSNINKRSEHCIQYCMNMTTMANDCGRFIQNVFNPRWCCYVNTINGHYPSSSSIYYSNDATARQRHQQATAPPSHFILENKTANSIEEKAQVLFDFLTTSKDHCDRFPSPSASDGEIRRREEWITAFYNDPLIVCVSSDEVLKQIETAMKKNHENQSQIVEKYFRFVYGTTNNENDNSPHEFFKTRNGHLFQQLTCGSKNQNRLTNENVVFLSINSNDPDSWNIGNLFEVHKFNVRRRIDTYGDDRLLGCKVINFDVASSCHADSFDQIMNTNKDFSSLSHSSSHDGGSDRRPKSLDFTMRFRPEIAKIYETQQVVFSDKVKEFTQGNFYARDIQEQNFRKVMKLKSEELFSQHQRQQQQGNDNEEEEGWNIESVFPTAASYALRVPRLTPSRYGRRRNRGFEEHDKEESTEAFFQVFNFVWKDTKKEDLNVFRKVQRVFDVEFKHEEV